MALTLLQTQLRTFHFNILKCKCKPNPRCKEASLNDVSVWGRLSMRSTLLRCAFHMFLHACLKAGARIWDFT